MPQAPEEPPKPQPPEPEHYPPWVQTPEERERWRLAEAIARQIFAGDGEAAIWMATRAVYQGDLPT